MRQIGIALDQIAVRTHNVRAFSAQIHGHKMKLLKTTSEQIDEDPVDPEDTKRADKALEIALERRAWQRKA